MRLLLPLFLALAFAPWATAQTAPGQEPEDASDARQGLLGYAEAIVLGAVEGITEFLPISSTGHLIITNHLLGLDSDEPVTARDGQPILRDDGTPMTLHDAAFSYAIVIQIGAIAAVVIIYWRSLLSILLGFMGRSREGLLLGRNLILGFLPAAFLGLLLNDFIEAKLSGTTPVAIALIGGAILILAAERWRRRGGQQADEGPQMHELSIRQSLMIGLLQCVAMWPGTSRSMMTIVGGYLMGMSAARAAEFSFLLGLITLSAAAAYKFLKDYETLTAAFDTGPALAGIAVAAITAALAVKWLVQFLSRRGLGIFAWYRIGLAICVLLLFTPAT